MQTNLRGGGGWVGVRGGQGEMDRWMDRQTGPNQFGGGRLCRDEGGGGGGQGEMDGQTNRPKPICFAPSTSSKLGA